MRNSSPVLPSPMKATMEKPIFSPVASTPNDKGSQKSTPNDEKTDHNQKSTPNDRSTWSGEGTTSTGEGSASGNSAVVGGVVDEKQSGSTYIDELFETLVTESTRDDDQWICSFLHQKEVDKQTLDGLVAKVSASFESNQSKKVAFLHGITRFAVSKNWSLTSTAGLTGTLVRNDLVLATKAFDVMRKQAGRSTPEQNFESGLVERIALANLKLERWEESCDLVSSYPLQVTDACIEIVLTKAQKTRVQKCQMLLVAMKKRNRLPTTKMFSIVLQLLSHDPLASCMFVFETMPQTFGISDTNLLGTLHKICERAGDPFGVVPEILNPSRGMVLGSSTNHSSTGISTTVEVIKQYRMLDSQRWNWIKKGKIGPAPVNTLNNINPPPPPVYSKPRTNLEAPPPPVYSTPKNNVDGSISNSNGIVTSRSAAKTTTGQASLTSSSSSSVVPPPPPPPVPATAIRNLVVNGTKGGVSLTDPTVAKLLATITGGNLNEKNSSAIMATLAQLQTQLKNTDNGGNTDAYLRKKSDDAADASSKVVDASSRSSCATVEKDLSASSASDVETLIPSGTSNRVPPPPPPVSQPSSAVPPPPAPLLMHHPQSTSTRSSPGKQKHGGLRPKFLSQGRQGPKQAVHGLPSTAPPPPPPPRKNKTRGGGKVPPPPPAPWLLGNAANPPGKATVAPPPGLEGSEEIRKTHYSSDYRYQHRHHDHDRHQQLQESTPTQESHVDRYRDRDPYQEDDGTPMSARQQRPYRMVTHSTSPTKPTYQHHYAAPSGVHQRSKDTYGPNSSMPMPTRPAPLPPVPVPDHHDRHPFDRHSDDRYPHDAYDLCMSDIHRGDAYEDGRSNLSNKRYDSYDAHDYYARDVSNSRHEMGYDAPRTDISRRQTPDLGSAPQYESVPHYASIDPYIRADPQYESTPRYEPTTAHYKPAPRYEHTPRYELAPEYESARAYEPTTLHYDHVPSYDSTRQHVQPLDEYNMTDYAGREYSAVHDTCADYRALQDTHREYGTVHNTRAEYCGAHETRKEYSRETRSEYPAVQDYPPQNHESAYVQTYGDYMQHEADYARSHIEYQKSSWGSSQENNRREKFREHDNRETLVDHTSSFLEHKSFPDHNSVEVKQEVESSDGDEESEEFLREQRDIIRMQKRTLAKLVQEKLSNDLTSEDRRDIAMQV